MTPGIAEEKRYFSHWQKIKCERQGAAARAKAPGYLSSLDALEAVGEPSVHACSVYLMYHIGRY